MSDGSVKIVIPLVPPSVNAYVRHYTTGRHHLTAEAVSFRDGLCLIARTAKRLDPSVQRFDVDIRVYLAERLWIQVPDVDNLPKLILDGLKLGGVFVDDRNVSDMAIRRRRAASKRDEKTLIVIRAAVDEQEEIY